MRCDGSRGRVFVASVTGHLGVYRAAVIEVCHRLGLVPGFSDGLQYGLQSFVWSTVNTSRGFSIFKSLNNVVTLVYCFALLIICVSCLLIGSLDEGVRERLREMNISDQSAR